MHRQADDRARFLHLGHTFHSRRHHDDADTHVEIMTITKATTA